MANIDIIGKTREAFKSRDAFNVHCTTKHCEQDPIPDQLKAAKFYSEEQISSANS
jgi:hypothetical protein